jgi:hypothetical protein
VDTNTLTVKKDENKNRIYVGLSEVSGVYTRIVEVLRKQGYPISFSQVIEHPFSYESEITLSSYRYEKWLRISRRDQYFRLKLFRHALLRFHHMLWAIRQFDSFFFVNGNSFLPRNIDLYLLRLFRKRVISVISHGSEARPAYMDGAHWRIALESKDPIRYIYKTSRRQYGHLARLERLSDEIIASPLSSQFLTRQVISAIHIGNPCVEVANNPAGKATTPVDQKIRIVHAPSDRRVKGSDAIGNMIRRLQRDNPNLEYTEMVGQTNADVLKVLKSADLVIDQLYSDAFLAGLGVEAGSFGVPVLVGNYGVGILKELFLDSPPPCFAVHPDRLESKLGELLQNSKALREVGKNAQSFIKSRQSAEEVAKRFVEIANARVPKLWYFSPVGISYVHGSGLAEIELVKIWKVGLHRYGAGFFCLNRRRDLLDMIGTLTSDNGLGQ